MLTVSARTFSMTTCLDRAWIALHLIYVISPALHGVGESFYLYRWKHRHRGSVRFHRCLRILLPEQTIESFLHGGSKSVRHVVLIQLFVTALF